MGTKVIYRNAGDYESFDKFLSHLESMLNGEPSCDSFDFSDSPEVGFELNGFNFRLSGVCGRKGVERFLSLARTRTPTQLFVIENGNGTINKVVVGPDCQVIPKFNLYSWTVFESRKVFLIDRTIRHGYNQSWIELAYSYAENAIDQQLATLGEAGWKFSGFKETILIYILESLQNACIPKEADLRSEIAKIEGGLTTLDIAAETFDELIVQLCTYPESYEVEWATPEHSEVSLEDAGLNEQELHERMLKLREIA